MKLFYSALLVFFFLFSSITTVKYGQEPDDALKRGSAIIPEAYDRSSLSWLLVYNRGDSHVSRIKQAFLNIMHSDKFFLNPLETDVLVFSGARTSDDKRIPEKKIQHNLKELNLSRQIISHWYSRTDDGFMDMERIHKRGLENATDADVLRYQSTARGNWALMDYGNRLIDKSYIITLDFTNIDRINTDTYEGYRCRVVASLFRVNLSEKDKEFIFESWVLEDDTEEEAQRKRELFETLDPPLKFVTQISTNASSTNYKEHTFLGQITPRKSTEELFADLVQRAYDNVLFELERDYEDFRVITPLYSERPLEAKIGKKEGLKVDQRFFVYEHRYNPKTQDITETRRGVIRATSDITDNRKIATGDMEPSRFYQVAGRRLREGYVLQQRNDYGIELELGASLGEIGGGTLGLNYSAGRMLGIRAFYLTGNIGINSKKYPDFPDPDIELDENVSFFRWDVGLAKGFHFFRNFEFRPYVAYGQEQATNDGFEPYDQISTHFLKGGADLALNITYFMQIVAGGNYYAILGYAFDEDDILDNKYTYYFAGREGVALFTGLRFKF